MLALLAAPALLTVISTFVGFLGSIIPKLITVWEKKVDYEFQLQITEMQSKAALDTQAIKSDADEAESLRVHDAALSGGKFVDSLRASVRPVITYIFFGLFVTVKVAAVYVLIHAEVAPLEILRAVWDAETMSLFATIVAFWFGDRFFAKSVNRTYTTKPK